ncbi:MAG: HD family phosphohydrolase [Desulfovibrionales bacterium]
MTRKESKTSPGSSSKKKADIKDMATAGPIVCLVSLLLVGLLGSLNFGPPRSIYLEGEIASEEIAAPENLLVQDLDSTIQKKERVAEMQPPVFDLSMEPFHALRRDVLALLQEIEEIPQESFNQKRWEIGERLNSEVSLQSLQVWTKKDFQEIFRTDVLPHIRHVFSLGIVQDRQFLRSYTHGIHVRNLDTGTERLLLDFKDVSDMGSLRQEIDLFLREQANLKLRARAAAWDLLGPHMRPNLILNQESTRKRVQEVRSAVEPVFYQIKKGEVIVRKGERVSENKQRKLQALFSEPPGFMRPQQGMGIFLVSLFLFTGFLFSATLRTNLRLQTRDYLLVSTLILSFAVLAKFLSLSGENLASGLLHIDPEILPYSLPVAGAVGLISLFLPRLLSVVSCLLLSYIATRMAGGGLHLFLFFFLSGFLYVYLLQGTSDRTQVLKTVFPLSSGVLVIWAGIHLSAGQWEMQILPGAGFVLVGSILSLFFLLVFSPICEYAFEYSSRFRLMELMDLEQPLLQDLMLNAPGTYHHSLIVANLVEAGARAIGANSLLVKVAALYHDIGKLKNPGYFIENQFGGKNRHDKLAPSMSALILTSHVKKGVEMARAHKLGPEIIDLIQQHHGTSLISYFYSKAVEMKTRGEVDVREEEFRYPGPKPQTKEAGLILLADVIEASSRTLVDPTPSRIKGHIKNTIRKIYTEGQLDDSELTLKDLNMLTDVFHRILTGIFHRRVEYPKVGRDKSSENQDKQDDSRQECA